MKPLLVIAAAIVALLVLVWHPPAAAPIAMSTIAPLVERPRRSQRLPRSASVVYVAGAVRRPGLYRLPPGARADDGIRAAGGMSASADASGINLAERVTDGEELLVPVLGAPTVRERTRRPSRSRTPKSAANLSPVDLNSAGADTLSALPGIGKTLAQRIVEVRERDGPFATLDDLLDVAGMTPARLEKAQPFLHI